MLPLTNFGNEWALILGICVRLYSILGAAFMFLYIPLGFPHPNAHAFISDEHIIYIAASSLLPQSRKNNQKTITWQKQEWKITPSRWPVNVRRLGVRWDTIFERVVPARSL